MEGKVLWERKTCESFVLGDGLALFEGKTVKLW